MDKRIEPGLLQVFRWFAILRIVMLLMTVAGVDPFFYERRVPVLQADNSQFLLISLGLMVLLVLYLYWSPIHRRLGSAFLPIALFIATLSLQLEPYLVSPFTRTWQPESFLFIVLILVAWQYPFGGVLIFIVTMIALELTLGKFANHFPVDAFGFGPGVRGEANLDEGTLENMILYGRLITRAISFVVIGLVINRLVTAARGQRLALAEANRHLREHSATLEKLATSRERNRLSRELHDTLAHTLSGMTVQLEAFTTAWRDLPAKAQKMIDGMLESTRDGLNETRRTLKDLRATPLDDLGLAGAVQALADEYARRYNWTLDSQVEDELGELGPDVEQAFYRIAQESLENIGRHTPASQVSLVLKKRKGGLRLSIEDNGQGFDDGNANSDGSLGLQLMRERAELIHAKLDISSELGNGTKVELWHPKI